MKTRVLIKEGEYRLSKAGVMDAAVDAEELYCFLKHCDKVVLFLMKETALRHSPSPETALSSAP